MLRRIKQRIYWRRWWAQVDRIRASFPEEVRRAYEHARDNRGEILASETCGCFSCGSIFAPSIVSHWVGFDVGEAQTAVCPICGDNCVIGSRSGFPLTDDFLDQVNEYWTWD